MSGILIFLIILAVCIAMAMMAGRKQKLPRRIMREGKLVKREIVYRDGEMLYVEKIGFKDWHICIHSYYLISDKLTEGQTIVDQRWSYEDFCNITVRLNDYTYTLIRQVEFIVLVRSFRPIPIDEFDRISMPLIM
jgi:hypothetical protein